MAVFIYGLHCPLSGEIRYIGKSVNPQKRLRAHISCATRRAADHHTSRWIRRLAANDLAPSLVILHEVGPDERWQDVERELIADAIDRGLPLTNSTSGGEGLDYLNEEDRRRYLANLSASMKRYCNTEVGKRQMAKLSAIAASDPDVIRRRNEAIREAYLRPEVISRCSEAAKKTGSMPSVKLARSKASSAMWTNEDYRRHKTAQLASDEFRAAQSMRLSARWSDLAARAKLNDARWTEGQREAQAQRIAIKNKQPIDPEMLARRNAAIKASWDRRKAAKEAGASK